MKSVAPEKAWNSYNKSNEVKWNFPMVANILAVWVVKKISQQTQIQITRIWIQK